MQAEKPEGRQAELLMRGVIAYLQFGMVYYHYIFPDLPASGPGSGEYGPINHMFPLTPLRLFEGGIEGAERTVTCVSGAYEWRHRDKPTVLAFDRCGRPKDAQVRLEASAEGWRAHLLLDDWNEIAVIEK
jgi:hypothetical protein